ncbi:MAG TPA: sigma-70 family RNA polymerase sigma factor [Terriglobales bacterium]|nr:sigma-70 family RNA polymerase sigma factor [Terriglobales bacterium]
MAINVLDGKFSGFISEVPAIVVQERRDFRSIYETHRHRIYNLAFYATDNEMTAEEICGRVFCRAFASRREASADAIDAELISVLRESSPIGNLTLNNNQVFQTRASARENVKRVALERAVVGLPLTEKLVFLLHDVERYSHERIARTLGITESESVFGLHQARIAIRQAVAASRLSS